MSSQVQALTDPELAALLQTGDRAAFSELYRRYWKKLMHYALQKTGDSMDAENIVQDIFVSLWKRREQLNFKGELAAYLTVSVKYRVIKALAKEQHAETYAQERLAAGDLLDDSTQQYLEFAELQQRLEQLVNRLPEKAQLIYQLSKDGLSHREIGAELGMHEKAVNTQLVRIRKNLRLGLGSFLHTLLL